MRLPVGLVEHGHPRHANLRITLPELAAQARDEQCSPTSATSTTP
jgi:hypothetical protein